MKAKAEAKEKEKEKEEEEEKQMVMERVMETGEFTIHEVLCNYNLRGGERKRYRV